MDRKKEKNCTHTHTHTTETNWKLSAITRDKTEEIKLSAFPLTVESAEICFLTTANNRFSTRLPSPLTTKPPRPSRTLCNTKMLLCPPPPTLFVVTLHSVGTASELKHVMLLWFSATVFVNYKQNT